jgi:hypothetical protein
LLPVARALGSVDAAAFADPAPLPPTLGDDVRRAVAQARSAHDADEVGRRREAADLRARRSRMRLVAVAATLLVALGVGGVVGRATAPEPPTVPTEAISMTPSPQRSVSVESADLVAHTWGVELRIVAAGFTEGETFRAAFRTVDGELVPAGEFIGVGDSPMTCFLQSAALRQDVTQVVITDDGGKTVLSSDL